MILVFSDEFNTDGRTFYPGEDPYWESEDLHYWVRIPGGSEERFKANDIYLKATNNLEWYDPEAITTANGSLKITFTEKFTHDLNYEGGEPSQLSSLPTL